MLPWLNRDLTLLIVAQGLYSFTIGYLPIILPLYLAALGFGPVALGLLMTACAVSSAIFAVIAGVLSVRVGCKKVIIGSSLLIALGCLAFGRSRSFSWLLICGALSVIAPQATSGSGVGIGPYYPASQALAAEKVRDSDRTHAFATIALISGLVAALGSLLAKIPLLLQHAAGFSIVAGYQFMFGVTAALNVMIALLTTPISETDRTRAAGQDAVRTNEVITVSLLKRQLGLSRESWSLVWRFMFTNWINGLAAGMLGPFVSYWFYRRFGATADQLATLFFLINLVVAAPLFMAAFLARRFGAVNVVVGARGVSALLLLAVPLMPSFLLAGAMYLGRQVINALAVPVRQSYVMGVVRPSERAAAAAVANLPIQGGSSMSSAAAGYLMSNVALAAPFEVSAILQMLNTVVYHLFFHGRPPAEESPRKGY